MLKKVLYLFLALLLPGLIFVFLKYQGKNVFTVPVFYEKAEDMPVDCKLSYSFPYSIPDTVREQLNTNSVVNLLVFPGPAVNFKKLKKAIDDEFTNEDVWMADADSLSTYDLETSDWKRCIYMVREPFQSVMIDYEGRIRGYYDLSKRDEIDKLRVEMKILLKKY